MNYRMVFFMTGRLLQLEAVMLVLPALVSLCYGEGDVWVLLLAAVIALVLLFVLYPLFLKTEQMMKQQLKLTPSQMKQQLRKKKPQLLKNQQLQLQPRKTQQEHLKQPQGLPKQPQDLL